MHTVNRGEVTVRNAGLLDPASRDLDTFEIFAGMKSWSIGMSHVGLQAHTFEILDNPLQDFLTADGFVRVIVEVLPCLFDNVVFEA